MNLAEIAGIEIIYPLVLFGVSYLLILKAPQPAWIIVLALAALSILSTLALSTMQGSMMAVLNANMGTAVTLFAFFLIVAAAQFVMLLQRFTFFETIMIILFIALLSAPVTAALNKKNQATK